MLIRMIYWIWLSDAENRLSQLGSKDTKASRSGRSTWENSHIQRKLARPSASLVITFYNIQPKNMNHHVYTFPLRTYGTVPKYPAPAPKQTVLAAAGIRRIPLSPDPALFPSPPLVGVSRVTAVQIHPTISRLVRAGSTRQTVPRSRPPRCGFTQQPKRDRSATWWPGDIHNRPSVHIGK